MDAMTMTKARGFREDLINRPLSQIVKKGNLTGPSFFTGGREVTMAS